MYRPAALLSLLAASSAVHAYDFRHWVGPDQGRWSDPANWSDVDGGSPGAGLPVAADYYYDASHVVIHPSVRQAVTVDVDHPANLGLFTLTLDNVDAHQSAGTVRAYYTTVKPGATYTQTGGRNVSGWSTGRLVIDGAYQISGGYAGGNYVHVDGSLSITGGWVGGQHGVVAGYAAGSNGTIHLSGFGQLTGVWQTVGQEGTGTIHQSGGLNYPGGDHLTLGQFSSGHGAYNLSGGTLQSQFTRVAGDGTGAFVQTGGTFHADPSNDSTLVVGTRGSYSLTGGYLGDNAPAGTRMTVRNDGAFLVAGPGEMVASRFHNAGTYRQTGGSVALLDYVADAPLVLDGGTLAVPHYDPARIAFNGGTLRLLRPADHASAIASLATAYQGGTWAGLPGSTAADDASGLRSIGYGLDGTNLLLRHTFAGDANLDGAVDDADRAWIVAGGTSWWQGDFNYDGIVDGDDVSLFDNAIIAYGLARGSESVPEPAAIAIALPLLAGLVRRTRRA